MIEAYTWPVAFTVVSTILGILMTAYKAITGGGAASAKNSKPTTDLQAEVLDLERKLTNLSNLITTLQESHRDLKASMQVQVAINKEAFLTTDKKLEKISDLIIELIRN